MENNKNINHTERAHATLSPSAAKRWMTCPGSVNLIQQIVSSSVGNTLTSNRIADEGTMAHEISEALLRLRMEKSGENIPILKEKARELIEKAKSAGFYTVEFSEGVKVYGDYILALIKNNDLKTYDFEKKLDFSAYIAGCFGTCDFCGYDEYNKHLHIADLKFGIGVRVDAKFNPQLIIYALAALELYKADKITLHIIQPRTYKGISTWITTREVLEFWRDSTLIPAAELTKNIHAPLLASESACQFCPAASRCPAFLNLNAECSSEFENLDAFSDEELQDKYIEITELSKKAEKLKKTMEKQFFIDLEANPARYNKISIEASRASRNLKASAKNEIIELLKSQGLEDLIETKISYTNLKKNLGNEKIKEFEKYFEKVSKSSKIVIK